MFDTSEHLLDLYWQLVSYNPLITTVRLLNQARPYVQEIVNSLHLKRKSVQIMEISYLISIVF